MMTNHSKNSKFQFLIAGEIDNPDIILHLKNNPISMEVDYIMDRQNDFFRIHNLNKGSLVFIAKSKQKNEIVACVSMLKFRGKIGDENMYFQYITDLIKDRDKGSALTMQQLLNYGLENYFDTDFVFGLINEKNLKARIFSSSKYLSVQPQIIARFNYMELVPISKHRLGKGMNFKSPSGSEEISEAIDLINEHYNNHLLFDPLDKNRLNEMIRYLPNFSLDNIVMMHQNENLLGVMIYFDPSKVVSLVLARMDKKTTILVKCIRFINRFTGLLFSPPDKGEEIKTIQVRYLAGNSKAQSALLSYANNMAKAKGYHSVSLLYDEKDEINNPNKIVFIYKSLMYLGYKNKFASKVPLFDNQKVFFDISYA